MKKWFLAACLPLMIVSCDIFGLGDDGDDDDTMIVDPPMANVSFDYEDKILSGDTLVLTTYVRLVDPEVLFNNMPMEIEVIDNLPADNNAGSASDESAEVPPAVGGTSEAYFIKVRIPESFNGYYDVRIDAVRSDYPSSGILTNVLERGVSVFTMQENGQADFHTGRPVWTDVSDALVLLETVDMLPERSEYSGMKFTTRQTLDSVKCFDAKEEFLPSARLYGFHTISSQYLFAYLTYTSHIDTIYSEMDGYVAYATPEEVTYPVVIVSDNGFILSFEELYREDAFAFNSPYDIQFRCDAADCFYFMPESERGATISDAAIYRVKIDEEMLTSIPQPIEEDDYEWIVRQIADVEQVHDGHIGASNSNEFSWQVYGDLVVLSESSLIDGRTSCSILPNSGTPSIDFVGTPSVFVSPQGSLCTLRRTDAVISKAKCYRGRAVLIGGLRTISISTSSTAVISLLPARPTTCIFREKDVITIGLPMEKFYMKSAKCMTSTIWHRKAISLMQKLIFTRLRLMASIAPVSIVVAIEPLYYRLRRERYMR